MADPISTFAIDNAGPNPNGSYNVVANSYCRRITIQENYDSANPPSADLQQFIPATSSTPARVAKGTPAIFTPLSDLYFTPRQIVGAIKTSSGSITVQQVESEQVSLARRPRSCR